MSSRLKLPPPDPYIGPARCPSCVGARFTDASYEMASGDVVLVVQVFCPTCGGCGRAEHDGCQPQEHDDPEERGFDPADEFDDEDDEPATACFSCHGRGWWTCQGFNESEVLTLRMPCGCAEKLLVPA